MIQVLNSILSTDICIIKEKNKKISILSSNAIYPEDYIEVEHCEEQIIIKEIHRSNEKIILETKDIKRATLVAGVLALRFYCPIERDEVVDRIKTLVKEKSFNDAYELFIQNFSTDLFSIGDEVYDKLSLIETGNIADVKYHSVYLVQGASIPRAYAVLYNYCKKRSFIESWCNENMSLIEDVGYINELVEVYLIGYTR